MGLEMEAKNMGAALLGVDLFSDEKVLDAPRKLFTQVGKPKRPRRKKDAKSGIEVEDEGEARLDEAGMMVIPDDSIRRPLHILTMGKTKPFTILRNVPRDKLPPDIKKPRRKIVLKIKDNAEERWEQKIVSTSG